MTNDIISRINFLLKHITLIKNDLKDKSCDEFGKSDLLVRATAFSLVQIGEQMNKLATYLQKDYPQVPWSKAIGMRNIIVHVYNNVDAQQIYSTATGNLDELEQLFLTIKKELEQ